MGTYSKKALVILSKVTIQTAKAFKRAIKAGMESDEAEDDEEEMKFGLIANRNAKQRAEEAQEEINKEKRRRNIEAHQRAIPF